MDKLDYCPQCGTKLDQNDEFCPNCGLDIKRYIKENESDESDVNTKTVKSGESKIKNQPVMKEPNGNNRSIFAIIILVIVLVVGYFAGNMYYSEARQEQSLQDELTSGSSSKMKNVLVNKDGRQFSDSQIGALKRLYLKDNSVVHDIELQISENQTNNVFSIKQVGKNLLIYPKYKIVMKTKFVMVDTNIDNPAFTVDGKSVAAKVINGEYRLSKMTPGVHDLKISNTSKSEENKQKQISIGVDNNESTITMNVKKAPEPTKTVTKVIKEKDDDNSETNSDNDSSDSSDNSLIGQYTGDPDLALYSDGTYDLGDKTGTYDIVENNNGHVRIRFNQDGGGSIVESYDYSDGELHSSKYDQSWYKD